MAIVRSSPASATSVTAASTTCLLPTALNTVGLLTPPGDLPDGGRAVSLGEEQLARGVEHRLPRGGGVLITEHRVVPAAELPDFGPLCPHFQRADSPQNTLLGAAPDGAPADLD